MYITLLVKHLEVLGRRKAYTQADFTGGTLKQMRTKISHFYLENVFVLHFLTADTKVMAWI